MTPPLRHDHDEINTGQRARAVCNHNGDPATCANGKYGPGQSFLALRVEIRVRLIKHHKKRVTIERARKSNALPLPGRKRTAIFADIGLVSVRQPQDQIMDPRKICGCQDFGGVGARLKP